MCNRSKYFNDDLRLLLILRDLEKVKARAALQSAQTQGAREKEQSAGRSSSYGLAMQYLCSC